MPGPGGRRRPVTLGDLYRPEEGSERRVDELFRPRRPAAARRSDQLPELRVGPVTFDDAPAPAPAEPPAGPLPQLRVGDVELKPTPGEVDQAADAQQAEQTQRALGVEDSRDFVHDLEAQYREYRGGYHSPYLELGPPPQPEITGGTIVEGPAFMGDGILGGDAYFPQEVPTQPVPGLGGPGPAQLRGGLDRNQAELDALRAEVARGRPGDVGGTGGGAPVAPGGPVVPGAPQPRRPVGGGRPGVAGAAGLLTPDERGAVQEARGDLAAYAAGVGAGGGAGGAPGASQGPQRDRGMELIGMGEDIARQRAGLAGDAARQTGDALDDAQRQRAALNRQRQDALGMARQRYETAVREAASMRVDPQRWWNDRGVAGGIAATIAMALGSFAEGLGGGPNRAAEMIQQAISRDVESQRMNAAIAREGAEGLRSAFWMARNQFEDADAAQRAAEALMLQRVQTDIDRRAAEIGTAEAKVNAETLRAELEASRQRAQQEAEEREADRALESLQVQSRAAYDLARAQDLSQRTAARGRGGAGGGRVRPITEAQLRVRSQVLQMGGSIEQADAAAGIAPGRVPADGTYLTPQQRADADAVDSVLREVEAATPPEGSDIPGVGLVDANVPALLAGDEGRNMRNRIERLVSAFVRLRSGASATDQERQQLRRAILGANTEAEFRESLGAIRREMEAIRSGRQRAGDYGDQGGAEGGDQGDDFGFTPEE